MTFELLAFRFEFQAVDELFFPPGKTANIFRGALGDQLRRIACRPDCPGAKTCPWRAECAYARFFEPALDAGPSGLADPARPFVLRPAFHEGRTIPRGSRVFLDVHVFDPATPFLIYLIASLRELARTGLGPGRGRAQLRAVHCLDESRRPQTPVYADGRMLVDSLPSALSFPLDAAAPDGRDRLRLRFVTPTELKSDGRTASPFDFAILIARLRDRIAALDRLYGKGTVQFDWNALAESAKQVRTIDSSLHGEHIERRSSRTGQVHPIGGFVGAVDYAGPVGPFLPILRAGQWTGVGRQTVWGKGVYELA